MRNYRSGRGLCQSFRDAPQALAFLHNPAALGGASDHHHLHQKLLPNPLSGSQSQRCEFVDSYPVQLALQPVLLNGR